MIPFSRYASLMKKEAVHAPGLTMAEGITRLHDEMSDLVGNDMNVNIEQDGERLISVSGNATDGENLRCITSL